MLKNLKNFKNLAVLSIIIAAVIISGTLLYTNHKKCDANKSSADVLSSQTVAEKALAFINKNMLQEGLSASLVSIIKENELYKLKIKVNEEEFEPYVSLDGNMLFVQGFNMEEKKQEVGAKRDKPDVKLFVMSYCPFGLQTQKALLPVLSLLKDKADMGVYFVNYIMHGKNEIDENLRQYCIQAEQGDKYSAYLSCFVQEGNFDKCLSDTGIDKVKMNSCISATDHQFKITEQYNDKSTWLNGQYPKFDVQGELNQQYQVGGSPTVVINDKVVNISDRSPEGFKKAICDAFTTAPAECNQTLSTSSASSGFGVTTGGTSGGSCQ
ncbi:MAG: hypothetical protein NTU58_00535 [Candidatus Nealsonbacteria bacterium]|nr:hypothetical protein [Candidatus Nealsonbacteria bacterium]